MKQIIRKWLLITITILLFAPTTVIASLQFDTMEKNGSKKVRNFDIGEGFEEGIMPPSGWTVQNYNPSHNWQIVNSTAYPDFVHSGNYAGAAFRDYTASSDEILTSPLIPIPFSALVELSFWVYSWTVMSGATLKVIVTVNETGHSDVLWDMNQDETWNTLEWRQVLLNLTQYAGKNITIAWEYIGIAGPDVIIDDIMIFVGDAPAPPIFDATMEKIQRHVNITVTLKNIQTRPGGNATDVHWNLHLISNVILRKFNETKSDIIASLPMGCSVPLNISFHNGFGFFTLILTATAPRADPFEKTFNGIILFRWAFIYKNQ